MQRVFLLERHGDLRLDDLAQVLNRPYILTAVGLREFTNIRTFWVQPADAAPPASLTE